MADSPRKDLSYFLTAKRQGRKFSVLTCYDVAFARLMEAAGVEMLLVGDTAGEVVLGLPSTRDVDPAVLIALTAAVRRGAPHCFVLADLPYQARVGPIDETVDWCRRFHNESGCDAVKIEVTAADASLITAVREAGIPVVAHLGLLPQYVDPRQGYRARGRDADGAIALIEEADRLEQAGAAMLLIEAVASPVAHVITDRARVPVIGCVAGPHCNGSVVVLHDLIHLGGGHPPRGIRPYADLAAVLGRAFGEYVADIHAGRFPREPDAITMKPGELDKLATRHPVASSSAKAPKNPPPDTTNPNNRRQ